MANGETKLLRHLQPGDRVLTMNSQHEIVNDVVMLMLDSQLNRPGRLQHVLADSDVIVRYVSSSIVLFDRD
jgi:hypothetical protein